MRILVTGAGGLVGGRLVPRLREEGHEVAATDRELDVTDRAQVESAVARQRPDALIHLAALSSPAESYQKPEATYRVNYLGSRTVLAAAWRHASAARVLLVGSGDVYGTAQPGAPAFREDAPLRPRSPYARSKAAADQLGAFYANRGLDVVRIRAFNHTGPGQSDQFAASSFARQIAEIEASQRKPVLRVGNLDAGRDFLDVNDVVEAYVRLLDRTVPASVYNVASGSAVRIRDLLEALLARATVAPAVEVDPERMRPTDYSVGNADRLRAATGWKPRVPLDATLYSLLSYWRDRVAAS